LNTLAISYKEAKDFLLPLHYSGRIPSISYAFGMLEKGKLVAVCTFGKPASPSLCVGVCGKELSNKVFELNRLCRLDSVAVPMSKFVAWCLRQIKKDNLIIVSYSDTGMNHHGYIYQACNFIYTGMTKKRTDKYTEGNKHSRHYTRGNQHLRKVRTAKHRYIYLACSKNIKKGYLKALRYTIMAYPKGDNDNYILGTFQKTKIINSVNGEEYLV